MSREIEEWKPVVGYESLYEVSDWGRVRSLDREVMHSNGNKYLIKGKFMTLTTTMDGYLRVTLSRNGKVKKHTVHRLVAQAFLQNPDNLPQVNHKDEDKTNNKVDNLEFCTSQYNNTYNNRHLKCAAKIKKSNTERSGKKIAQYTLDGELVKIYPSTFEASRQTGYSKQGIMIACHGGQWKRDVWIKSLKYKGFIWKYAS